MSEYTPTTDEVREAIAEWAWSRRMFRPELGQSDGREADRWFAVHDDEVASTALTEVWREYASRSFSDSLALLILDDPTEQQVAAWLAQYTAEKRAEWEAEQGTEEIGYLLIDQHGNTVGHGYLWPSDAEAAEQGARRAREDTATNPMFPVSSVVAHRRKAGPWMPVEQETDDA